MYVKLRRLIVGYGKESNKEAYDRAVSDNSTNETVTPELVFLYECADLSYRKVSVVSGDEFEGYCFRLGSPPHYAPFGLPGDWHNADKEFIHVCLSMTDGVHMDVLAFGPCSMYVMNNSGKTIDVIHCA